MQTFSTDSVGNALYIVDAYSGALLWSAGNDALEVDQSFAAMGRSMDYSIPARIRVVDFDGDGYADRFYAGDMGGQIWRFDVTNGNSASTLVAGGVIAQLGAAPAAVPATETFGGSTTRRTSRGQHVTENFVSMASARAIVATR